MSEGLVGAIGLLIGAIAMKLIPAISDWIVSRAGKGKQEMPPGVVTITKANGNGHLTKEQLSELLLSHEKICGGRIEMKLDNLDEKVDAYHGEQREIWDRINDSMEVINRTQTQVAVVEGRLSDHLIAAHRP
jgi:hypothetical protein